MKQLFTIILCLGILSLYAQPRYYKAQMHCHTTNSDGAYSPQDLALKYKAAGYEIMMISDHNHLTLPSEVNVPGVLCIASEEITFKRHMNGFFLNRVIMPTPDFTCQQAIDSVKLQGGLIMLNHYCEGPITNNDWAVSAQEILSFVDGPDMLEIWNTGTETIQTNDDKSIWDAVLTAGKKVWGSATDDFHPSVSELIEFNKGWNMLWLDSLCEQNVFDALVRGDFYASTGVEISHYSVTDMGTHKIINIQSDANKIAFWGPNHQKITEFNGSSATFTLMNHPYIRAELTKTGFLGMGNKYAWTQPVFLENTAFAGNVAMEPVFSFYPNPAQNVLNIQLALPYAAEITVSIFDMLGRQLPPLFNDFLNAGSHNIQTSISGISAGTYMLQVTMDDIKNTQLLQITH